MARLAITGGTGNVGRLVAVALVDAAPRLIVRPESAARAPAGATLGLASYGDHDAAVAALRDIDVLFMVSAAESADRIAQHRTFVDAAVHAGVKHVVYTSFLGAAADCTFTLGRDHWATEAYLRESGLGFTFLRDSLYLDFLPVLAGTDGVIRGPAGAGVVGAVARADVARVAAAVLGDVERHAGATYDLTGREALSLAEVAQVVSAATGRTVRYHDETLEEAYASRASYGAPAWQVDAWVSTYTAIAAGELAELTDVVPRLTGREAITLREYLAAQ